MLKGKTVDDELEFFQVLSRCLAASKPLPPPDTQTQTHSPTAPQQNAALQQPLVPASAGHTRAVCTAAGHGSLTARTRLKGSEPALRRARFERRFVDKTICGVLLSL